MLSVPGAYILISVKNVLILHALPHEIGPLVRSLRASRTRISPPKTYVAPYRSARLVLLETGIGGQAATRAFLHQTQIDRPDIVVSAGFGGALYHNLSVGEVVIAGGLMLCTPEGVKNSLETPDKSGLLPLPEGLRRGSVITLQEWMQKRAVREVVSPALPYPVCDMETFYLADAAARLEIPFIGIRSVSDGARTEIPLALLNVYDPNGVYQTKRALSVFCRRPFLIPKAIQLALHGKVAARQLSNAVLTVLDAI